MNPAVFTEPMQQKLSALCVLFRLPSLTETLVRRLGDAGLVEALPVILAALEQEESARQSRRVERLRKASHLPSHKTFATLEMDRLPRLVKSRLRELARGDFLNQATNVLAFGLPGVGKSHALAALGHALVEAGRSVYWTPAYQIVQELLAAKRDLRLPQALHKYDVYDALLLDDLGYIQQSPEEAEVLFTLMAERYERRSLLISSNLVFSEWERIFKNPLTTAAAIDRLVHHSTILEFREVPTYRGEAAAKREAQGRERPAKTAPATHPITGTVARDDHDNHDNSPPSERSAK